MNENKLSAKNKAIPEWCETTNIKNDSTKLTNIFDNVKYMYRVAAKSCFYPCEKQHVWLFYVVAGVLSFFHQDRFD